MGWGGANRPKAISRLGRPTDREGADGDIQIMGTHSGAKFFAKWAGKWLGISDLLPAEEERPGVFTPKVWQKTISTGTAASFTVGFPEFITPSNFITYTIAVPLNTGTPIVDYWFIDSSGASSDTADSNYSFGLAVDWVERELYISDFKTSGATANWFDNTKIIISVFFKT